MRYVKYIGLAHRRGITAQEWRSVGINAETVFWGAENGFAIPADRFTDEQIRRAIDPDENFIIVGLDEAPAPLPREMTPQEAEGPRVDIAGAMAAESSSAASSGPSQQPSGRSSGRNA